MRLNDSPTDNMLPYWASCLLSLLLGMALMFLATHPEPMTDNPPHCATEDEVPVRVIGHNYDMENNSTHCIHIDAFRR